MYRRLLGGGLLLLVMLAVIVPPRRMGGQAILIDPLTGPAVGECLSQPGAAAATASTRNALVNDPTVAIFGPCGTGPVAGEVVAVWSAPPADPFAPGSSDVDAAANTDCWRQAARFAGLDPVDHSLTLPALSPEGTPADSAVRWRVQVDLHVELVISESATRWIHRGWLACTVTSHTGVLYAGRVHNAFAGGALPALFATCRASIDYGSASVPCDSPHPVESLALGDAVPGTTEDDLAWSCRRLAAKVMRQDDPTDNGQLIILGLRLPNRPGNYRQSMPVNCLIVTAGDWLLNDTVVGLSTRQLPISH